ncbi:trehalose 6-phosphate synthase/phosphatase [Lewinella marina]|uniref:Bifunctional alpha,alpha-trehalose-phosphate synthase (UDP-forming)/trehalose-phosphatase n=1 Tax=Neolewinella marina TaxID=438751 RepID=A0A2G0CFW3_9BACT|nr:bifunctional alpha,alpha-trehalose-phosphate synthase (UDP-forming)/trehalose-phosphatase [Neolewinella marina]NJB85501.1 trehalose 6-phosphate synthase/phosphatase [Neolewinella marina]PHK98810.1 bifunctional alpha,alpha-trehalose-phosphate synthase (UDP-forming)/trehalose-phosphatase [Neolewinella marina]
MSRLVIISNRLPITVNRMDGELHYHPSAGGLATGLNSLDDSYNKIWIGWPGEDIANEWEREAIRSDLMKRSLVPVFLTEREIDLYYEGFSNKTIWPHFHYFTEYTVYNDEMWQAYQEVNFKFFQAIEDILREDDMVWVHDYQLMLLPAMIREKFPKISMGFFLHIPFPSYEVFRILPWRKEILDGILGSDQVGFHTFGYMRHFLSAAYRITGYEHEFGRLTIGDRQVNVDVFPMGIEYDKYAHPNVDAQTDQSSGEIRKLHASRKIILSVDRLDYTKGIPHRIRAFGQFIRNNPEYIGKVNLIMIVVPSRANVDQYQSLKTEVDILVSQVNSEYGTFDWMPIHYYYRSLNFAALTTLYKEADIALITPLRDGMNLVAKEYIAAKDDSKRGVLILSEMAGAVYELNDGAITVNPQSAKEIEAALIEALEMDVDEQHKRMEEMQEKLKQYDVKHWAATFIREQQKLKEKNKMHHTTHLSAEALKVVAESYEQAAHRLLFIDYDGTLMSFDPDPQAVKPDQEVLDVLVKLASDPKNTVVINSGRDRTTLEKWLGHLDVEMAAEHGVWMKENKKWQLNSNVVDGWKPKVRELLENLVSRTPGSFIEEKDYSLAWHYRNIDRDLGNKRVREFRDMLTYLIQNQDLQVLEGNKVVEIKNSGVNKGKATQHWVNKQKWDFVLGIGDDSTDEDIFRALPDWGVSIKVGPGRTAARYSLTGVSEVRRFFTQLGQIAEEAKA